jgi:hypothetical protein
MLAGLCIALPPMAMKCVLIYVYSIMRLYVKLTRQNYTYWPDFLLKFFQRYSGSRSVWFILFLYKFGGNPSTELPTAIAFLLKLSARLYLL